MFFTGWRQWLRRQSSSSRSCKRRSGREPNARLRLELLEQRLAPATRTWSGAGVDNLWSDAKNWQGNVVPVPVQDSLVFPANAAKFTSQNDFAASTDFQSITFTGGGYTVSGNPMLLGTLFSGNGGITDQSGTNTNVISLNIQFAGGFRGTETLATTPGTVLTIAGKLSGAPTIQLQKRDTGTVILSGDNSGYTGPITVSQGA